MVLRIADYGGATTVLLDNLALGYRVDGVIGALAVHVRSQRLQQGTDGQLRKDDDVVHAAKRGDQFGSIGRGHDRPARPLELTHHIVVIDADDEQIRFIRGGFEVSHVADVQQVEAAVGKGNRSSAATCLGRALEELLAGNDFTHGRVL